MSTSVMLRVSAGGEVKTVQGIEVAEVNGALRGQGGRRGGPGGRSWEAATDCYRGYFP